MIGVCKSADDVSRITTKTSREVSKRALNLIDTTGKEVAVTLWGEEVITIISLSLSLSLCLFLLSRSVSGMDLWSNIKTHRAGYN